MYSHNDFDSNYISNQLSVASRIIDRDGKTHPLFDRLFLLATNPSYASHIVIDGTECFDSIHRSLLHESGFVTSQRDFIEKVLIGYYNLNVHRDVVCDRLIVRPQENISFVDMTVMLKPSMYFDEVPSIDSAIKTANVKVVASLRQLKRPGGFNWPAMSAEKFRMEYECNFSSAPTAGAFFSAAVGASIGSAPKKQSIIDRYPDSGNW